MLKWKLLIGIVVLWVFGLIGIMWSIYQNPTPPVGSTPSLEAIKISFIALGGLGVILPTYLNVWNSLESRRDLEEDIRLRKIENTYQLIERWESPALLQARRFTRAIKDNPDLTDIQLVQAVEADKDLKESVLAIFNYFESMRLSIKHERVQVDFLKDTIREAFLAIHKRFKPWVDTQSQKYQDDIGDLYRIFEQR